MQILYTVNLFIFAAINFYVLQMEYQFAAIYVPTTEGEGGKNCFRCDPVDVVLSALCLLNQ